MICATKPKKIILIGINDAGKSLIKIAADIVNRVEIISFESNSDSKIEELLKLGEHALNISLNTKDEIIESVNGSFYLTQLLAYHSCIEAGILNEQEDISQIEISFELVKSKVQNQLAKKFKERTADFAQGSKLRQEGRAPYLNILYKFAKSGLWTLDLRQLAKQNPELKGSVSQIITKGHLETLYQNLREVQEVIYYDPTYQRLTIQDPQYLYYLQNIAWHTFSREIGYLTLNFPKVYDFALSFSGEDRIYAEKLFQTLQSRDVSVFYDKNEQHRIIAEDVEDYLRPIYQSESEYIVVFLGKSYPNRIWAKIESEAYDDRYGKSIIPIEFPDTMINFSDKLYQVGRLSINPTQDIEIQINSIADTLCRKLVENRENASCGASSNAIADLFQ